MTQLINRERPAHWYRANGQACHTVLKADGKGERATTLADARKANLFPSVTSILSIKAKPALDAWKLEQAILSSLTLPRGKEETEDAFAKRITVDMQEEAERAATWGSKLHDECEDFHKTGVMVQREDTYPYLQGYEAWFKENIVEVIATELTVVNALLCYAGRVDLVAVHKDWGRTIFDLKTQKVKKEAAFYPEYALQLGAYREAKQSEEVIKGTQLHDYNIASIIIDSQSPGPATVKKWDEPQKYVKAFLNCVELWKFDRDYYPQIGGN